MSSQSLPIRPPVSLARGVIWGLIGLVLLWFFAVLPLFGSSAHPTTAAWLVSTWTPETNYEHGWLVVGLTAWLLWRAWPHFRAAPVKPAWAGLVIVILGILLFIAGWRLKQARINVAALPVIVYGASVYVYGWSRSRHLIFPLSMVMFVVPMPNFQQMTTGLQLIATKMAYTASNFLGIHSEIMGNRLFMLGENMGQWEIDEGCSGIRSIVALALVTYVYGMIVHKKWSERLVIFAACIPIAMLANAVRVTSILLVGRVNLEFAKSTWHDYSGFMSFGAALALLMLLSFVMRFGIRALRPKVTVTTVTRS